MHTHPSSIEREMDSRGASTLVNTIMDHDEYIYRDISYWQRSINENQNYMSEQEKLGAKNIKDWYELESKTRSYSAPGWKISPERTAVLEKFRNDPNYYIKNIVELAVRSLIFEMLRAEGKDAKVVVTSDSDDAFGGTDVIAIINTPIGEEYLAYDIAVSENTDYLEKKSERTETICYEFDAIKKLKHKPIPRQVFAIAPCVMARFISAYMKQIITKGFIDRKDIVALYRAASVPVLNEIVTGVRTNIAHIIH